MRGKSLRSVHYYIWSILFLLSLSIACGGSTPEQPLTDYRALGSLLERSGLGLPEETRAVLERSLFDGRMDEFNHDSLRIR
jgi:hypothetical protein